MSIESVEELSNACINDHNSFFDPTEKEVNKFPSYSKHFFESQNFKQQDNPASLAGRRAQVIQPVESTSNLSSKASSTIASIPFSSNQQTVLVSEPWYKQVLKQIPRETYLQTQDSKASIDKIIEEGAELCEELEGPAKQLFEDDILGMAGVSLVASYLKEKHNLEGLYVCSSLEAFQQKLVEISRSPVNVRVSMVIPWDFTRRFNKDEEYEGDPSHKLTVCIEKDATSTKIAILDSLGGPMISPYIVNTPASNLYNIHLPTLDCVLWYINHSGIDLSKIAIYYSALDIQRAYFGCETHALRTAVSFLRFPGFFDKILTEQVVLTENGLSLHLHEITHLPLIFLKGVQSRSRLFNLAEEYIKNMAPQPPTKDLIDLYDRVKKHIVLINGQVQNHYINRRSHKYHQMVLTACKLLSSEKIAEILQKTLLMDARPPQPGTPRSPSDAFLDIYEPIAKQIVDEKKEKPVGSLNETSNLLLSKLDTLLHPERKESEPAIAS